MSVCSLFKKHLNIILDGTESALQLRVKTQLAGHDELLRDLSANTDVTEALAYEQIFFRLWNHIEEEFTSVTPVFV